MTGEKLVELSDDLEREEKIRLDVTVTIPRDYITPPFNILPHL